MTCRHNIFVMFINANFTLPLWHGSLGTEQELGFGIMVQVEKFWIIVTTKTATNHNFLRQRQSTYEDKNFDICFPNTQHHTMRYLFCTMIGTMMNSFSHPLPLLYCCWKFLSVIHVEAMCFPLISLMNHSVVPELLLMHVVFNQHF